MIRNSHATGLWLVAAAVLLVALTRGLPADAFFSGDSGAKLVAAREALAHPTRPLDITVPTVGGRPAPDLLGTFFVPHQGHAHVLTSPLFPILSALPLALLGERGLYLLPGLSWLLTLWLAARLSRVAEPRACAAWGVLVLVAGTPLLFYALEFWEHAPAVSLTTAATLAALHPRSRHRKWLLVGLLSGVAALLRPEAAWYGIALVALAAAPWTRLAWFAAGFAVSEAPFLGYNLFHFRSLLGPHLAKNSAAALSDWVSVRWAVAHLWFVDGPGGLVAILIAGAALAAVGHRLKNGGVVMTAGTLVASVPAVAASALAALRMLPRESLWATFPLVGFALLPLGPATDGGSRLGAQYLRRVALLFIALAWLTTPHGGGAQWGPRFLLPACVPLALVSGFVLRDLLQATPWRWVAWPSLVILLFGSMWVQRSAYRDLRVTKRMYARMVAAVEEQAGPSRYVLSDIWWLDLVAARLRPPLTFLYAESGTEATAAVGRLASVGASPLLIVRTGESSVAGPTNDWLRRTCYRPGTSSFVQERSLTLTLVRCETSTRGPAQVAGP